MNTIRVLLADDNHEFRRLAASLLGRCPRVLLLGAGAANGEEAISQAGAMHPDLVLMDMLMPGTDGLEATRRIKAANDAPQVVVITLHDNPEARMQSAAAGADGFMAKTDFADRIGEMLDDLFPGTECCAIRRTAAESAAVPSDLERLHRMATIGEMAVALAHDLGSLLGVMGVAASGLRRRLRDDPRSHGYTEAIAQAVDAGSALVKRVVATARSGAPAEPTDVSASIAELVPLLGRCLPEGIDLDVDLDADAGEVDLPAGLLEHLLLNLVLNARDAIPGRGRITIATEAATIDAGVGPAGLPPGRYVVVAVADNGVGMSEQVLGHVFEPFFSTKAGATSGLGLTLVRSALQARGGYITADSRPGAGSRFTVYLPRSGPAAS